MGQEKKNKIVIALLFFGFLSILAVTWSLAYRDYESTEVITSEQYTIEYNYCYSLSVCIQKTDAKKVSLHREMALRFLPISYATVITESGEEIKLEISDITIKE